MTNAELYLVDGDDSPLRHPTWEAILNGLHRLRPDRTLALVRTDGSHIRADGARLMYTIVFYEDADSAPLLIGRHESARRRGRASVQGNRVIVSPLEFWGEEDGRDVFKTFFDGVDLNQRYVLRDPALSYTSEQMQALIRSKNVD